MNYHKHFNGMSPNQISSKIEDLKRDFNQFSERIDSLSSFLNKSNLLNQYLNENQIIFEIIGKEKELKLNLKKSIEASNFIERTLKEIMETSYHEIIINFEKLQDAIHDSKKLIELKLKFESDFSEL